MYELLFGTILLTAFAGGVVALLAPCCVSVMLPAYLSTVFRRRGGTIAATGIFALGVATVIVPIGLGASALAALFVDYHTPVFSVGGAAMIVGDWQSWGAGNRDCRCSAGAVRPAEESARCTHSDFSPAPPVPAVPRYSPA